MEPLDNIGFRCEKCGSEPDPQYQEKPFEWFVGKHCKLSFPTGDANPKNELMWVKVEGVQEIEGKMMLVGYLDNDPIFVTTYEYLDGVAFERHEIHAVAGEDGNFPVPRKTDHGQKGYKDSRTGKTSRKPAPAAKGGAGHNRQAKTKPGPTTQVRRRLP